MTTCNTAKENYWGIAVKVNNDEDYGPPFYNYTQQRIIKDRFLKPYQKRRVYGILIQDENEYNICDIVLLLFIFSTIILCWFYCFKP